ncbi:MAG TPA: hypothetical protein VLM78_05080, partial [Anaerolineales bacterium]|nr:hypothetical protein [Anaerolineales bacterium]
MKRTAPSLPTHASILALLFSTSSCRPAEDATAVPMPCPTPTASPHPTVVPTKPATRTPRPTPAPDHTRQFLDALPTNPESCHPDQTTDDLGIYIYDLEAERELVSINADVPFQFASAFKAPVLVYFLSSCRQYWDPSSPQWEEYFQNTEAAQNVDLFTSPEYEAALSEFIANPENWTGIGNFSTEHRQVVNDANGAIDTRYFVLGKVYGMIARSSNPATAEVLQIVFENCLDHEPVQIEPECGGPNAITAFNAWFNDFS